MMDAVLEKILKARTPEEVFGKLGDDIDEQQRIGKKVFRHLSKVVHPDANSDARKASEVFHHLVMLWDRAQASIEAGTYGQTKPEPLVVISDSLHSYNIFEVLPARTTSHIYLGKRVDDDKPVMLKVAATPRDNPSIVHEAETLATLLKDSTSPFCAYFPKLHSSFTLKEGSVHRQVNVFDNYSVFYTLEELITKNPNGYDAKDMAWIWRRLLLALGYTHEQGIVHGAVLPFNIVVHPTTHELKLLDWCTAKTLSQKTVPIVIKYQDFYPSDIASSNNLDFGTDIYMGAKSMVFVMGGNVISGILPNGPKEIQAFMRGCSFSSAPSRPQGAWALLGNFNTLIQRLWGARKYRALSIPS